MIKIIDISHHVDSAYMDYAKVAQEVDGVILRIAYGNRKDTELETHYAGFSRYGVPMGGYHYLVEWTNAQNQFQTFQKAIEGKTFQLDFWPDVELEKGAIPLTRPTVEAYHAKLEDLIGKKQGFYSSRYYWDTIMKTDHYKDRKFWVANYGASIPAMPVTGSWKSWWMWQYTTNYILQGYSRYYNGLRVGVDGNHFYGGIAEFNDWVGEDIIVPGPEPDKPLYRVEVITTELNVRSTPIYLADGSNIVKSVFDGDILDVFAEERGWLQTPDGWVSGFYTRLYEEEQSEPEPMTLEERVADHEKRITALEIK